eukprot:652376-Rhodomonas_salina.15
MSAAIQSRRYLLFLWQHVAQRHELAVEAPVPHLVTKRPVRPTSGTHIVYRTRSSSREVPAGYGSSSSCWLWQSHTRVQYRVPRRHIPSVA